MAKVMLSVPDQFLEEIDRAAVSTHRSRSQLIRDALRSYLTSNPRDRRPLDDPRIRQALASLDELKGRWKKGWRAAAEVRRQREHR